ncbi:hypothetical protein L226DRAFT_37702 [Lentinus tigrinus ALCF2SS1-7]|uniref:F-box domain-containing protein n=1 Tax=Lentinus tigrinus ALCF2SS1-6 TaxID=1328759 RepID=A0A5C2SN44_9APHY|nr:hypothetical protein L227DRAFT_265779 [Lentinus tigrinus ALCF2SS1-6]RPD82806.1 hypothetical protein L226DRAFT_37702 [Lentinus tigrinus ALCF2SS1-7]
MDLLSFNAKSILGKNKLMRYFRGTQPLTPSAPSTATTTQGTKQLDIDTVYAVLEHVKSDKDLLKACSLVCKAWEPPSQSNLFRTLKVYDWPKSSSLGFLHFDNFLSTSPRIAAYILHLELEGEQSPLHVNTESGFMAETYSTISVQFMERMLSKLPMLQSLRLYHVRLSDPAPSRNVLHALQRFHYVDVPSRLQSRTFPALLSVLALFPSIDHLILHGNWAPAESDEDKMEQILKFPGAVEIRAIDLSDLGPHIVAPILHAVGEDVTLERFHTFAIRVRNEAIVPIFGSFLHRVRDSMQNLRLDLSWYRHGKDSNAWKSLRLSEYSALTSLVLSLAGPSTTRKKVDHMSLRLSTFVDVLKQGTPPSLRRVTLHVDVKDDDDCVFLLDWGDLDRTLCRIPSLASFVFHTGTPSRGYISQAKPRFSKRFASLVPKAHERGIVEIRERDHYVHFDNVPC